MSSISKEELRSIQTDPIAAVSLMFNKIEESDSDVMIVDPSSPFSLIMETIAFNSSVLRDEINTKYHRLFSKLANSDSDLYNNISYRDFKNIFAQPATAMFRFVINITNFTNNAIEGINGGYKMVTIPELSTISVEGFNFIIANSIDIKEFENGTFSIEQNISSTDIGVSTLGVLPYTIVKTEDNNRMLVFDTVLKQLTLDTKEYTINKTDKFSDTIYLNEKIHYISASTKNGTVSDRVEVSYTEIIDPNKPTIIIKMLKNAIEVNIPDVYIINNLIRGKLILSIFTTLGEVDYPLDKLESKNFKIEYKNTTTNAYTAAINNVSINNTALHRLTGGADSKSFEDLRESVIANSIGDAEQPITKAQILDMVTRDGYYGYLLEDTITSRLYIASKSLPIGEPRRLVNAKPDLLFYKTRVVTSEVNNHDMIITTDTIDDRLTIKPNTLMKYVNGIISPLNMTELTELRAMNEKQLFTYLNSTDILYSPYSYISSLNNELYSLRIIDFRCQVTSFNIKAINTNILYRANIEKYSIELLDRGYLLTIKIAKNSEFDKLDKTKVKAQLKLPIAGDDTLGVYYQADYDDGYFRFNIDTDYYVDETMGLWITNGASELASKSVDLSCKAEFITYIKEPPSATEGNNYINQLVYIPEAVTATTLEGIDIIFGSPVEHLHKNLSVGYTDRKYLTYADDVIARYDKDIYDTDDIGSLLTPINGNTDVTYTLLHAKDDPILNSFGQPTILHPKGSYVLDVNGKPTINRAEGVVKYIDMLLLEYNGYVVNRFDNDDIVSSLHSYYQNMIGYRDRLLEETIIKYKPFRNSNPVKIRYNNSYKLVYRPIKPEVELFIETDVVVDETTMMSIQTIIGAVIHKHINKEVFYNVDIKDDIKESLNFTISAIRINLDRDNESILHTLEKVALYDVTNRLRLGKIIQNNLGYPTSTYDVNVTITRI